MSRGEARSTQPAQCPHAVRLTVAQIGSSHDVGANIERVCRALTECAPESDIVVFPETVLSGYVYESRAEATARALRIDGPELADVAAQCAVLEVHAVVGLLERTDADELYNSAVLIDDDGTIIGHYRKTHLPHLGVDRFTDKGADAPPVVSTKHGNIGLAICYDLRFPEVARSLALAGADVIAQPSTWPYEAAMLADHFTQVRACENRVFVAIANRGDSEAGWEFMGRSLIASPSGSRIVEASEDGDEFITATVDLAESRDKHIVNEPGVYEVSLFDDRRPELYQRIVANNLSEED
jgi:predicted amidohydrolase